jgi:acetyltransferase-like isoleucine patch superfamily enzyme
MTRIKQVLKFGWIHAGKYANSLDGGIFLKLKIYWDILCAYAKYKMWSNQYLSERFYEQNVAQRKSIGESYREKGIKRDLWQKDFRNNRKFLLKYSDKKYELARFRSIRNEAYRERFNAGQGLFVEYDVNISRQHYLEGTISIGKHVLFAKHVFIDYSGTVIIEDDVKFSHGALLESHTHGWFTDLYSSEDAIPCKVLIEKGALIGANSIILDSCAKIGRYARIGSGAVVRNSVPPYAIVVGNPAKVVGFTLSPDEVQDFEKDKFDVSKQTNIEQFKKIYEKYFVNRIVDIKQMLSN